MICQDQQQKWTKQIIYENENHVKDYIYGI